MKEGTPLGARVQSAIQRAAVLYKPRLTTFNFNFFTVSCGGFIVKGITGGTHAVKMCCEVRNTTRPRLNFFVCVPMCCVPMRCVPM
jgi:hypothetical protein